MEDYQTPPALDDRLAIVIIHGIGNQQPLDTLIPFAKSLIEAPANLDEPKFWSKPDQMSESFELRRLTARKSSIRPTTDFYEYYWAHRIPGATYKQLIMWARRLLLVHPKRLIPKIRKFWAVSWITIIGVIGAYGYLQFTAGESVELPFIHYPIPKQWLGVFTALLLPVIAGLLHHVALKYVGDAARYLQPDPENIQLRHEIRAKGIKLLRNLHAAVDGKQRYSRIVVVGHSLGSVIAYDILKNLWDEFNDSLLSSSDSVLAELEAHAHDLQITVRDKQDSVSQKRQAYRQLQRLYWREQQEQAKQTSQPAWLVSDFITLGSPLVHAEVLLNTSISSVDERKAFKELPTCPPQMALDKDANRWKFSYNKWENNRPGKYHIPDHAALFGCTVWTNMYFQGDVVGDKLAPILGPGIKDIELSFQPAISNKHKYPTSHTAYWKVVKESTHHLTQLRDILGFSKTLNPSNKDKTVSFTKRKTLLGRQCEKALWLDQHEPDLKTPPSESDLLRFDQGNAVDKEAHRYYPDGVEVTAVDWALALHSTQKHIKEKQKRIYQGAFEHNGLRIRADILDLNDDGTYTLREVKMSTSKKDEHIVDLAIQVYVLGSRVTVKEAKLVLVDKAYVAGGGSDFFIELDVTEEAQTVALEIGTNLSSFKAVLGQDHVPAIDIGPHCKKPWTCPFHAHCWADVPRDSIYTIPRLSAKKKKLLSELGVIHVKDVPDGFELTEIQSRYVQLQKSGQDATNKEDIWRELNGLAMPFYFLDFETYSTPLPTWHGTSPNQQVPFQFSCHKLEEDGTLTHHEFLHTSDEDPRQLITESLVSWIGEGTIMVYNDTFERKVLQGLAAHLPEYADQLNGMIERLFDQLDVVKKHVAHPGLLGSNSLKRVSDVLLGDHVKFDELDIKEGASAQASWYKMVQLPEEERSSIAEALIAYCRLDTLAQVELHRWFMQ